MKRDFLTAVAGMHFFEMNGNSMNDGSANAIESGDILFGELIEPREVITPGTFGIVTSSGVLVKIITACNLVTGVITCDSLNRQLQPFSLPLADITALYLITHVQKNR